jgi:trans-aconitate 2-methyltransferase
MDTDHPRLLKDMMGLLKNGGVLAVQIPNQFEQPIHIIIRETASQEKWAGKLGIPRHFYNLKQSEYFDVLFGIRRISTYGRPRTITALSRTGDIIEWYRVPP